MKIGIYNAMPGIGGSEYYVSVLAEALCQEHEVDLLHHNPDLTIEQQSKIYGTKLNGVQPRYMAPPEESFIPLTNPLRRYREERVKNANLSQGYDLFIASIHHIPPFCQAQRGALIVHFPVLDRHNTYPWMNDGGGVRKQMRRMYANWEWRKRFEGYQVTMVNSKFTQKYTKKWWDIDSQVIYAPTESDFNVVDKENMILSVGRFTKGRMTSKNQLELTTAFKEMKLAGLNDWSYYSVGVLGDNLKDHHYFNQVNSVAAGCGAQLRTNLSRAQLNPLYERAKIFWHAAGYGVDDTNPIYMEHFGIVTVEAMAAGCIPIVIAKGGQPDIVEHEVSGFLWNTLDELKEYTMLVVRDKELQARMSEAARLRSRFFSKEMFIKRFMKAMQPILKDSYALKSK